MWYQTLRGSFHGKKDVARSVEGSKPNDLAPTNVREKEIFAKNRSLSKDGFAMTVIRHLLLLKIDRPLDLRLFEKRPIYILLQNLLTAMWPGHYILVEIQFSMN